jgi:hypothetical protein
MSESLQARGAPAAAPVLAKDQRAPILAQSVVTEDSPEWDGKGTDALRITIGFGRKLGALPGMHGQVIDAGGKPVPGGAFVVDALEAETAMATVHLRPEQIHGCAAIGDHPRVCRRPRIPT